MNVKPDFFYEFVDVIVSRRAVYDENKKKKEIKIIDQ